MKKFNNQKIERCYKPRDVLNAVLLNSNKVEGNKKKFDDYCDLMKESDRPFILTKISGKFNLWGDGWK